MDARDEAWDQLHESLPARWRLGPPSCDPGRHAWSVSAVGPHPGRGRIPVSVSGIGDDEVAALRDLNSRLRGGHGEGPRRLDELRARRRLAYVQGAEDWAVGELGRRLTAEEFLGPVRHFPVAHESHS